MVLLCSYWNVSIRSRISKDPRTASQMIDYLVPCVMFKGRVLHECDGTRILICMSFETFPIFVLSNTIFRCDRGAIYNSSYYYFIGHRAEWMFVWRNWHTGIMIMKKINAISLLNIIRNNSYWMMILTAVWTRRISIYKWIGILSHLGCQQDVLSHVIWKIFFFFEKTSQTPTFCTHCFVSPSCDRWRFSNCVPWYPKVLNK